MDPDEVARGLRDAAYYFSKQRGCSRLEAACANALRLMAVSRHVEVDSDRGDSFLIEQLARAAKECDSALLDAAAVRLRSLVEQNESLRRRAEAWDDRESTTGD